MRSDPHDPGAKSGADYWEQTWQRAPPPPPIDPLDPHPGNYFYRLMDRHFATALGDLAGRARLIEIGCGGSRWLPYLAQRFGLQVTGIDYTEAGCSRARGLLEQAGIAGEVLRADMFDPPLGLRGRFDVGVSFGLVEHFQDTAAAVAACTAFLGPGGRLVTLVPTMRGLYGLAYRLLRPRVYAIHRPQSRQSLARAHAAAGLRVLSCDYLLGLPGIVSSEGATSSLRPGPIGRLARGISNAYWRLEQRGLGVPPNPWTSPYVLCVARRP
jgi:SAM-dependent methyltransferase